MHIHRLNIVNKLCIQSFPEVIYEIQRFGRSSETIPLVMTDSGITEIYILSNTVSL